MPANWVVDDDVNGIFNAVQEHQEANIIDIWTKAETKIYPVLGAFEAKSEDAARDMLPTALRKDAKIIRLNQFTADQIRSFHKG